MTANTNAVFGDTFREKLHVIPTPGPQEEDPEVLVPEPGCVQLFTAWDPVRSTTGWCCSRRPTKETDDGKELPVIKVLDEVELIQSDLLLDEVTEMVLEKMAYWSGMMDDDVMWTHISDTSASTQVKHDRAVSSTGHLRSQQWSDSPATGPEKIRFSIPAAGPST